MKPLASVIIPALDEEKNLRRCLTAVFSQQTDFEYEVMVIDSGSKDRTLELAKEFAKSQRLRVLQVQPSEFNHGRTRQYGVEQAEGDFLVFLVADAEPADKKWLSLLVECCRKDERVAGAYSRQAPREGASIIEKLRLAKRVAGQDQARTIELASPDDYWVLDPLDRILLCDFDDVSSVRRRSVLSKIPIPACDWAEDLVWSRECLLAGYKIGYEPRSVVRHSHQLSPGYLFKRGWIDQKAASAHFGQVYYPDFENAVRGFFIALDRELKEIRADGGPAPERRAAFFKDAALLAAEIAGRYLARAQDRAEANMDLSDELVDAEISPPDARERVARTAFAIGNRFRKVILANPPARIDCRVLLREDSELKFGIGVKPGSFKRRKAPIDFSVLVDGARVFQSRLEMVPENLRDWKDFSIDLAKMKGKAVRLSLVTESGETDYGWAAWAEPGIFYKGRGPGFGFGSYFARLAAGVVGSKNFRHN